MIKIKLTSQKSMMAENPLVKVQMKSKTMRIFMKNGRKKALIKLEWK